MSTQEREEPTRVEFDCDNKSTETTNEQHNFDEHTVGKTVEQNNSDDESDDEQHKSDEIPSEKKNELDDDPDADDECSSCTSDDDCSCDNDNKTSARHGLSAIGYVGEILLAIVKARLVIHVPIILIVMLAYISYLCVAH